MSQEVIGYNDVVVVHILEVITQLKRYFSGENYRD